MVSVALNQLQHLLQRHAKNNLYEGNSTFKAFCASILCFCFVVSELVTSKSQTKQHLNCCNVSNKPQNDVNLDESVSRQESLPHKFGLILETAKYLVIP